jgi:hypothetical protein
MSRTAVNNPYTPNAGACAPRLVGRVDESRAFELLLDRLKNGYTAQSMIAVGLRRVGKTMLLSEFRITAVQCGWTTVKLRSPNTKTSGSGRQRWLAERSFK